MMIIVATPSITEKNNTFLIFLAMSILLYPILNTYGYGFISFGYIFLCSLLFYSCFKFHALYLLYPKALLIYILYFLLVRLVTANSFFYKIAPSTTSMFVFLGFLFYNLRNLKVDVFIKIYRWIAYLNIILFFVQELMFEFVDYRILGILSFLPLTIGNGDFDPSVLAEMPRSSALFSEPSHFVQFLLPLVAVELFYVSNKKAWIRAGLFIAILLLLQSGNAILGLAVILVFLIYYLLRGSKKIYSIVLLPLFLIGIIVCFSFLIQTEEGEKLLNRMDEVESDNDSYISSGFIRIYRGYFVYREMTIFQQIFGLNDKGKIIRAVDNSEISFAFADGDLYFNGIQGFLIHNGLFGLFLFFLFVIWLWRDNNIAGKCVLVMLCSLMFIASLFFTHTMLLYLVVAFFMKMLSGKCTYKVFKLPITKYS